MSHGFDAATAGPETPAAGGPRIPGLLGVLDRAMRAVNQVILVLGGVALVAACLVLSDSVVVRYFFKQPTEWQDEMAVFLIVGATFFSAAAVQAKRGHVAIEALTGLLSPKVNRIRLILADIISLAFVAFFTWKSWSLFHEAYVDGQTSQSTWGPPLSIPYGLMAAGMTLLTIQFLLQIAEAMLYGPKSAGWAQPKIGLGADLNRNTTPETADPMGKTVGTVSGDHR
ncbi:TRAP transporter small permease [Methylobacterium gnaphalii]|uniref:TRAP transporter small permease protein n=1 Tax=Methylobacterium gnaphalii TaxID=1010610 RepID=A0A512JLY3_9HYPH|nr:TRAP transporter small permease [Methylobacterium gnaphalii]GEP10958.1 hypothetical protein MGN01_28030 [Methylobacterium gnaphalii]GJD69814.1 hypothetical protein MMMDOFMJ_2752 [Methylobacterium gnaphalii]GLS48058.1 hypothetical protein GCM10007885_09020 [Methylobacterium gnaphalii]